MRLECMSNNMKGKKIRKVMSILEKNRRGMIKYSIGCREALKRRAYFLAAGLDVAYKSAILTARFNKSMSEACEETIAIMMPEYIKLTA